jgi:hypothetical protein
MLTMERNSATQSETHTTGWQERTRLPSGVPKYHAQFDANPSEYEYVRRR